MGGVIVIGEDTLYKLENSDTIEDILMYLPEWIVIDTPTPHKHPANKKDKPEKPRHKEDKLTQQILHHESPEDHPNTIHPFIHENELKTLQSRKQIRYNEVIQTYRVAYFKVLNYLNRERLPKTPIIHEALCMWTAGLLEKKYKFKQIQGEDPHYQQLHLVRDAQDLLEPYIRRYFKVLKTSNCNPEYGDSGGCEHDNEFQCNAP